jgi:hypothetical protein
MTGNLNAESCFEHSHVPSSNRKIDDICTHRCSLEPFSRLDARKTFPLVWDDVKELEEGNTQTDAKLMLAETSDRR